MAQPLRVAGADPGTSSLDLLILEDGAVGEQCRFTPEQLQADPALPVRWLSERGPFHLIAGPSGYGLPLVRAADCTPRDLALMTLVRPDERGPDDAPCRTDFQSVREGGRIGNPSYSQGGRIGNPSYSQGRQGVLGFSSLLRELLASALPVIFLPGVIHLPTVPPHRKINRIDLGTADKLCVAALALAQRSRQLGIDYRAYHGCVLELGSAFTAALVLSGGQIVDGLGGTSGPPGWRGGGAWDGELAYLLSPLQKRDLFTGGVASVPDSTLGRRMFREALVKAVSSLHSVTRFEEVVLSGRLLESEAGLLEEVAADLSLIVRVIFLESVPGAWVKHAAQGAALLADGLAGGRYAPLVEHLAIKAASGTVLDWVCHPSRVTI